MEQLCWMRHNLKLWQLKVSPHVFTSSWTSVFSTGQVSSLVSSRSSSFVASVAKGPTFSLHRGLLWEYMYNIVSPVNK